MVPIILIFLCLGLQPCKSEVVYVSQSPPCSVQSKACFSLKQLATNSSWVESNTTLIFLPGIHSLFSNSVLSLSNISYISLVSDSSIGQSQSRIVCQRNASFIFYNVSHVWVNGLKFLGCKCSFVLVKELSIKNSTFQGEKESGTALEIIYTNANITNSSFICNRIGRCLWMTSNTDSSICILVGGAIYAVGSIINNITIVGSRFESNGAEKGGAMFAIGCKMTVVNTTFINNCVTVSNTSIKENLCNNCGIAKYEFQSTHYQTVSSFITMQSYSPTTSYHSTGGAIALDKSSLSIDGCVFRNNTSRYGSGGILMVEHGECLVQIYNSKFYNSHVKRFGGVLVAQSNSYVIIDNCTIYDSSAYDGGVVYLMESNLIIKKSILINNTAGLMGGVLVSRGNSRLEVSSSLFIHNKAGSGGVLFAVNSFVYFEGNNTFLMNNVTAFGGAIHSSQSVLILNGSCTFRDNEANAGGAINIVESSRLDVYNELNVTSNIASTNGGGLYLYRSKLNCHEESKFNVFGNRGNFAGGGIFVANSFINIYHNRSSPVGSSVHFVHNVAKFGGGICLESSAQLRIIKSGTILLSSGKIRQVYFDSNSADYGSAIMVADETYFDACLRHIFLNNECFLQVISKQETLNHRYNLISIDFATNNLSQIGGSTVIYGGLLDRCTLNFNAEIKTQNRSKTINIDGVTYLKVISNINDTSDIASEPLRLCFCSPLHNKPDCSYNLPQVNVTKGERFQVSLVAVDEVNHTIDNVIIHSSLSSPHSGLGYGQMAQKIANTCTNLNFSISSSHSHEELILYAEGPCRNVIRSQSRVSIAFQPCTCPKIGFQPKYNYEPDAIICECVCDVRLYPYITDDECNYQTGSLTRKGKFWISYVDIPRTSSSGFVMYTHCPLDYCLPNVPVNLNIANGSDDSQCAKNRSGILCGACQQNLSLSLGSSLCIQCSIAWHNTFPAMLTATFVAGIILVILLMILNLTVAVGTLNGIIFYTNILGANGGTMISSSAKVPSLFVSWLNLEVGFDVCFFEGMDTYWKTWLQLAFPSYVILLVVLIIIISDHSIMFSRLLAKRNPVATLATLILLSYTMYLRTIIAVLSVATLNYPDGSTKWVWFHDGTVEYLSGKHIALFVVAMIILIVGIAYTGLVFFWPWLLHHQNKFVFKWVRSQKLHHFMVPYHAPYNVNHRYWTGLLLFARVTLYLVFALNVSGDPGVNLLAITLSVGAIMLLRARVGKIYKSNVIDWLEMICYSNATLFSAVQLYLLKGGNQQANDATAYVSGVIVIVLFLIVILYHMWRECGARCLKKCTGCERNSESIISCENVENLTNYPPESKCKVATPTFSVLEGPTYCQTLTKNADCNKRVCKPNTEIESDDNVSVDSATPLLEADR